MLKYYEAGSPERPTPGRDELLYRLGGYAIRRIEPVLYGTNNLSIQGAVEPRSPGRPVHDPVTGEVNERLRGVYGSLPIDLDSPIWHATILPYAPPYTAGRKAGTAIDWCPYFAFMINPDLRDQILEQGPVPGAVYLLNPKRFRPSPYNPVDVVSETAVELLDPDPVLVTYEDLSFDLRNLNPVDIMRASIPRCNYHPEMHAELFAADGSLISL
jgi:hypothetical protein